MTPEQKARVSIDALLVQAGWHVCNVADANIHASTGVAIPEFPLNSGFGFADYLRYVNGKACGVIAAKKQGSIREVEVEAEVETNVQCAQALRQATLAKAFAANQ